MQMLRLRREEAYGGALARGWQRMSEAIISAEIGWVSHSGHDRCSLFCLKTQGCQNSGQKVTMT